jgi:transglycosylase-like protein with SLT domain
MLDRTPYTALIQEIAQIHALSAPVLEAQVLVESGGDRFAFRIEPQFFRSYIRDNHAAKGYRYGPLAACSYGLLQIVYETALEHGFTGQPWDLFDPRTGLTWGATHLASLVLWAGGDLERALAAFNGGRVGNVTKPYRNAAYVDRVRALLGQDQVNV